MGLANVDYLHENSFLKKKNKKRKVKIQELEHREVIHKDEVQHLKNHINMLRRRVRVHKVANRFLSRKNRLLLIQIYIEKFNKTELNQNPPKDDK